jgi:riboflavin-specific deaminase-like protein
MPEAEPRAVKRPFVSVNFALTWDGKISTRRKTRSDFSSLRDKHRLLEIRALGDAVLVGKTTVEKENMSIGLPDEALRAERTARGQTAYPLRVIVTNSGRISPMLPVFQKTFSPILIYSTSTMPKRTAAALRESATLHLADAPSVDLLGMLHDLRRRHAVKHVICEGGPTLLRSLLELDLVDELFLTVCPRVFGGAEAPTLTGLPGAFVPASIRCKLLEMQVHEGECFLRYRVVRPRPKAAAAR